MLRVIRTGNNAVRSREEARGLKKRWILIPAGALLLLGLAVPWLPQRDPVRDRAVPAAEESAPLLMQPVHGPSEPPSRGLSEAAAEGEGPAQAAEYAYLGSANSDKYHLPTCSRVGAIREENLVGWASREEAEAEGREPCGICKPGQTE